MKMMHTKQRGVTLVELMLAMAIGLIVMLGVGTVYSNSKKTYRVQEEFSRLQENGRFALQYIARFVRGAGYAGCASGLGNTTNTLNEDSDHAWKFTTGIEGYEAIGTAPNQSATLSASPTPAVTADASNWKTTGDLNIPGLMLNATDSVIPFSDVLVSRSADGSGVEVVENNDAAHMFVSVTTEETNACPDGTDRVSGICDGDILLVSDCKKSRVFQATNIQIGGGGVKLGITHAASGDPGNSETSWGGNNAPEEESFGEGAEIMKISTKTFYVGKGVNGPALFMKQDEGTGQEIVDGIETLQVLYGEDMDADNIPDRFVTAEKVTDYSAIVAVKLSILLSSASELAHRNDETKSYVLTGHSPTTGVTIHTPTDKRMRRVMSMVVKLRNRGFTL